MEVLSSINNDKRKAEQIALAECIHRNYTDKSKIQIPKTLQEIVDIIEKAVTMGEK